MNSKKLPILFLTLLIALASLFVGLFLLDQPGTKEALLNLPSNQVNKVPSTTNTEDANINNGVDWLAILRDAETTLPFSFAGLTFEVPQNMKQQISEGVTYLTFPINLPEGPFMSFSIVSETPENVMAGIKNGLSQFERIVTEGTTTIHGQMWFMIERTTDFGINQVVWLTDGPSTVQVMYTPAQAEVTKLFETIVLSVKPITS